MIPVVSSPARDSKVYALSEDTEHCACDTRTPSRPFGILPGRSGVTFEESCWVLVACTSFG